MTRRKIAILGGGMAALTAAFHLSRNAVLRAQHEVTVYQIGWRLGGKGATGRREADGRILEHGLHIWFGYYDNAFRMLREVFRELPKLPDDALQSWRDAFKPHAFTPVGPDFFPLNWPVNDGTPGDGHVEWTPWQAFTQLLGMLAATAQTWHEARQQQGQPHASPVQLSADVARHLQQAQQRRPGNTSPNATRGGHHAHAHDALQAAASWARAIGPTHQGPLQHHLPSLVLLLAQTSQGFKSSLPASNPDSGLRLMHELLDLAAGFARGFVHDVLIAGRTARDLDALDFRAWLASHGSDPDIVARSFITRALYDTMFQYLDGDLNRPSYAAGTAVQVVLRLFGTSKGAALWEMQAGMGEVVVAPLYRLLKQRGVKFRFFREVTRLALDGQGQRIQQVHLKRQAELLGSDYEPTFRCQGLDCWPDQPRWEQLKDGAALRSAGVDFECPWSAYTPAGQEVLQHGVDFDEVVLGICLGAFKKLNADPTLADELCAARPAFKSMVDSFSLLPSMALQVWSPRTLAELGWTWPKPATVAGVEPLDIWADMSQTLAFEPPGAARSVHYLTGVMNNPSFRNPRSAHGTQQQATAALTRICQDWLTTQGPRMWPLAVDAAGAFDWQVLLADANIIGPARLQAQYVRANVSPAECCVVSVAGQTRWRLKAQDAGFANLKLAGTWVDTGFNTECIEAAVMSGMQAARAICGQPVHVLGEDLLQRRGHGLAADAEVVKLLEETGAFAARQLEHAAHLLQAALAQPPWRAPMAQHKDNRP